MRFIVIILIVLICVFLYGAVFTQINFADILPDTIMLAMVSMVLLEGTMVPVFFFSGGAMLLDVVFSRAFGFYALPYLIVGMVVFVISKGKPMRKTHRLPVIMGICVLAKELITAFLCVLLRYNFNFGIMLTRFILPEMLLNALLIIPIFFLFKKLYKNNFMRPQMLYTQM